MLLVVIITVASALQPPLKESTIARLCEKQFVVVENAVPSHLVESLRRDALSLRERGKFKVSKIGTRRIDSSGAVTSKAELTLSTRVSETGWLRPRPQRSLGDCLARDDLDDYVESLRVALRTVTGAPLDPFVSG